MRAGDKGPDTRRAKADAGHVVSPTRLRDKSTLEALTSTLRTWRAPRPVTAHPSPPYATSALTSPSSPWPQQSLFVPGSLSSDEYAHLPPGGNQPAPLGGQSARVDHLDGDDARAAAREGDFPGEDKVLWGAWDEIVPEAGTGPARRVLLLAYPSAGISVWDCSALDSWYEVLNLPSLDAALGPIAPRYPLGVGDVVGACILPPPILQPNFQDPWIESRPLLAILTRHDPASHLFLYSLRTHQVVHALSLPGAAHRVLSNPRHLAISTSHPLALHVFSAISLDPTPFSPLLDVAPSPFDAAPVFDLGKGGRVLAYATDRPVTSSRQDGEPARPGAGTVSQRGSFDSDHQEGYGDTASGGSGGFRGDARTAGQVGGEVARRVGEGVLSGVKAIGDIGLSYWPTKSSSGGGGSPVSNSGSQGSPGHNFSKSAPLPSFLGFEHRSSPPRQLPRVAVVGDSTSAGTVAVVDLLSFSASSTTRPLRRKPSRVAAPGLKLLAHFRPYLQPIALISLAPSSSFVLTSSSQGHSFDIFEMKPAVAVGVSATNAEFAQDDPAGVIGKAWHRYRLTRGFTAARATTASWSPDLRFVAVGTGKGTTHVYATQPFGGKANFSNHFAPKLTNSQELQPLSVTLSTITRIRRARLDTDDADSSFPPPCLSFISKADSLSSAFRLSPSLPAAKSPPPTSSSHPLRSPKSPLLSPLAANTPAFQDCLLFYPQSGTCVLDRLSVLSTPTTTDGGALDVGRLATTVSSGLSQLMKNRGQMSMAPREPDMAVSCVGKAEWAVARKSGWGEVREELESDGVDEERRSKAIPTMFSAEAEIETFSRSPRVLPRSIYQSPQFDFFALPPDHLHHTTSGDFALPLRRLEMRSEVQIRHGGADPLSTRPSSSSSSSQSQPASFDQPIKSAMHTILDSEAALVAGAPKPLPPMFPNGVAGKQGTWRDALPIPSVNEGLGRVRKELGRVRVSAIVSGRRASSSGGFASASAGAGGGETYSSSISFEDDDAVFADRVHSSESGSTAGTSEEPDGPESDDASWGLDGLEEEPADMDVGAEGDSPPFEDFFDDFVLDQPVGVAAVALPSSSRLPLPRVPTPRAAPATLPLPLPLPLPIGSWSPGGLDAGGSSSFLSLEPSPRKESHLGAAAAPASRVKKSKRKVARGSTPVPAPSFC